MSGTVPGRMRRRLAYVVLAAFVAAGVLASTAAAIRFTDDSCANDTTCRPTTGTVGASYFWKVQISPGGGTAPYTYTVSSGALPPGLSLNSGNGEITGTAAQSGTYTFFIDGGDACPDATSCINVGDTPPCNPGSPEVNGTCRFAHESTQRDFTIRIEPGLKIVTNSLPQGATVGAPYSATLEAQLLTNLNPPTGTTPGALTWSIVPGSGALPPGLTLGNGVISGTPTTEGTYSFKVQAQLDASRKNSQTYSITVRQPLKITAPKPFATSPVPTVWEVGVPFAGKLTASGGSGTYTIALATGSTLPTGLILGPDGSVTGTPRAAGSFRAVVHVTDTETRALDYQANFAVAARLKVSTVSPLRPAKVGKNYVAKLKTTGGTLPRKWRVTVGPLPRGIRLDRTTGVLSGTPTKAGTYRITVQVTDGLKVVATKKLRLDVGA